MRSAFKSAKRPSPQVNLLEIGPATIFKDAKTVAGELQKALNVLARTPAK
jgi:hypothetical protein